MGIDGSVEISSESITCGFKKCPVGADLGDARVVCFGKWDLTIQRASGDQRDTDVGSK